jgi:hypothetical protein
LHKDDVKGARTPQAAEVCAYMWENDQQAKQLAQAEARLAEDRTRQLVRGGTVARVFLNEQDLNNYYSIHSNDNLQNESLAQVRFEQAAYLQSNGAINRVNLRQPAQPAGGMAQRKINDDNRLSIFQAQKAFLCTTCYKDQVVHRQFLPRATTPAAQPARQQPANAPLNRQNDAPAQPVQQQAVPQRANP